MLLELETKGQRLLPICVHTLYNLTCVDDHFKGMDRIAKALLNITPTAGTALLLLTPFYFTEFYFILLYLIYGRPFLAARVMRVSSLFMIKTNSLTFFGVVIMSDC